MADIQNKTKGLKTALDLELKSSEGQREILSAPEFFGVGDLLGQEGMTEQDGLTSQDSLAVSAVQDNPVVQVAEVQLPLLLGDAHPSAGAESSGGNDVAPGNRVSGAVQTNETRPKAPGRPKGAKNRSTEEWRGYFFRRFQSPLVVLGKLYSMDTVELSKKMSCDRIDALKMQVAAANAVLPYVHQKQPIALELPNESIPVINITVSQFDAKILNSQAQELGSGVASISEVTDAEFSEILERDGSIEKMQ